MGALVDTSLWIAIERETLDLKELVSDEDPELYLSVISVSELLHGLHRATKQMIRATRSGFIEDLFDRFPILPIDTDTAKIHSGIWADLARAGNMIGMNDLWLAATCLANDLTMFTANKRDLERIPGLKMQVW